MTFLAFSIILINMCGWVLTLFNYLESAVKLIRKPYEFYVCVVMTLFTMSITYPQSAYYYIGSIIIVGIVGIFISTRSYNLYKMNKAMKELEKNMGESMKEFQNIITEALEKQKEINNNNGTEDEKI